MRRILQHSALFVGFVAATPAMAATVFTDNFNTETAELNASLANFAITGSIDLIAAGNPYGVAVTDPASGNIIDLDGTGASGSILSIPTFAFNAGDRITLQFDIGGSQRGGLGDDLVASLLFGGDTTYSGLTGTGLFSSLTGAGTAASLVQSGFVAGDSPFVTSTIQFFAENAGTLRFGFSTPSADNIGPLLDNILLDVTPAATPAVPEPTTWATMIFGMAFVGASMRRRRRAEALSLA